MTWVAEETFDTYSDGDLAGQNGGSGWGGAWVNQATDLINVQGSVIYQGSKAVSVSGSSISTFYTRVLNAAVSAGVIYFAHRKSYTNTTTSISFRNASGQSRFQVNFQSDGNIRLIGSSNLSVAAYSVDTWYVIRITFDLSGNITLAYNTGSGWSSESSAISPQNSGDIDRVGLSFDTPGGGGSAYFDILSPTDPVTPPVEYAISGVVTLSGTPVEGAIVRCIRQSDNVALVAQTTDSTGEYAFMELDVEELYHLSVEYEAESQKYNALSYWDIVPVEVS